MSNQYVLNLSRHNLTPQQFQYWQGKTVSLVNPKLDTRYPNVITWMRWGSWVTDGEKMVCVFWSDFYRYQRKNQSLLTNPPITQLSRQ
jgi:hypothetical protein